MSRGSGQSAAGGAVPAAGRGAAADRAGRVTRRKGAVCPRPKLIRDRRIRYFAVEFHYTFPIQF